jgi:hypothetical protein
MNINEYFKVEQGQGSFSICVSTNMRSQNRIDADEEISLGIEHHQWVENIV